MWICDTQSYNALSFSGFHWKIHVCTQTHSPFGVFLGYIFWVFHSRDLTPFLIHLSRAFTFHHYFIIFYFSHFIQPFNNFYFPQHNHDAYEMQWNCISSSTISKKNTLNKSFRVKLSYLRSRNLTIKNEIRHCTNVPHVE